VVVHAEVYVLAERLLMRDLKELALKYMARTLAKCYGTKPMHSSRVGRRTSDSDNTKQKMDPACLVQAIDTIYEHTIGPNRSEQEAKEEEAEADGVREEVQEGGIGVAAGEREEHITNAPASSNQKIGKRAPLRLTPKDRMRILIARYSASCLSTLKQSPKFLQLLRTRAEFSEDMLLETLPREEQVAEDEVSRL
jgi:hypothetical protein